MNDSAPSWSSLRTLSVSLLVLTVLYSVLRYNVFGTVPWSSLPVFVLNKAISLSSLCLLAAAYIFRDKRRARDAGVIGFTLMLLHVVLSLAILNRTYYPKLFAGDRLSLAGEICIVAGSIAAVLLMRPFTATLPGMRTELGDSRWLRWQRTGYVALALIALHCAMLGVGGWIAPSTWPGGLPPISMISFLVAAVPLARLMLRATPPDASREKR